MGKLDIIEAKGTERLKRGFAKMVKGGVIMDVTNPSRRGLRRKLEPFR